MLLPAVTFQAPPHVLLLTSGVAIKIPDGKLSTNAALEITPVFGLETVNDKVDTPLTPMLDGVNDLAIDGGTLVGVAPRLIVAHTFALEPALAEVIESVQLI